ncbi:hypothetical protein ACFLZL_02380 [Thermodesulfobacteriota bacterium]
MKKTMITLSVFCLLLVITFTADNTFIRLSKCIASDQEPTVIIEPKIVKMNKKAVVNLSGKGFKPNQEVRILIFDTNGVLSDIGDKLKPEPKSDKTGSWSTTWSAGRFVSKKLVKNGEYKIFITNTKYKTIVQSVIIFSKDK